MILKSEVSILIKSFVCLVDTQFGIKVRCIRSDNASQFLLKDFYNERGIVQQTSCVGTPQQNGIVGRNHQHLLNTARALVFQSKLPKQFWDRAVSQTAHIINRLPTKYLSQQSPFEVHFERKPEFNLLKVFGSFCFATYS